jgi:hypothetical protein
VHPYVWTVLHGACSGGGKRGARRVHGRVVVLRQQHFGVVGAPLHAVAWPSHVLTPVVRASFVCICIVLPYLQVVDARDPLTYFSLDLVGYANKLHPTVACI